MSSDQVGNDSLAVYARAGSLVTRMPSCSSYIWSTRFGRPSTGSQQRREHNKLVGTGLPLVYVALARTPQSGYRLTTLRLTYILSRPDGM